jgi:hypothetical protein
LKSGLNCFDICINSIVENRYSTTFGVKSIEKKSAILGLSARQSYDMRGLAMRSIILK